MNGLILNKKNVHLLLIGLIVSTFSSSTAHRWLKVCRSKSEWSYSSSFPFCPFLQLSVSELEAMRSPSGSFHWLLFRLAENSAFFICQELQSFAFFEIWPLNKAVTSRKIVAELIYFRLLLWWFPTDIERKWRREKNVLQRTVEKLVRLRRRHSGMWRAFMAHLFIGGVICILSFVLIHLDWSHTTHLLLRRSSELFLLRG